jgi:hypothetical protein
MDRNRADAVPLLAGATRRQRALLAALVDELEVPAGTRLTSQGEYARQPHPKEEHMNARELGASRIPYGPHAVGEAIAAGRQLAGAVARRARLGAGAAGHLSEATEKWIARFEPREVLR